MIQLLHTRTSHFLYRIVMYTLKHDIKNYTFFMIITNDLHTVLECVE